MNVPHTARAFLSLATRTVVALAFVLSKAAPIPITLALAQPGAPNITVQMDSNSVRGHGWPFGALLTLTIDDPGTSQSPDYTDTATPGPAPWDPQHSMAEFFPGDNYTLAPGQLVTITDGAVPKEHIITALELTDINPQTDVISGIANANGSVSVCANVPGYCVIRHVTADGFGSWTADFSVPGDDGDEQETVDIQPGTNGWAAEYDIDSDATWRNWHLLNPNFNTWNWTSIHGYNWPLGHVVTLTVDDDADPGNGILYTDTDSAHPAPWDPNNTAVEYYLGAFNLVPGHIVTMSDSAITKTMTVVGIAVTNVDPDSDTVSGTAPADMNVNVYVHDNGASRNTAADSLGNWSVDFSVAGNEGWENQTADLVPGTSGNASAVDADGDGTGVNWRVSNPNFAVWPVDNRVEGWEWPLGATVTLTVDDDSDPGNGILYTDSQAVQIADWDPTQTHFNFNLWGLVDVQPGNVVTVTDSVTTKTHITQALTYDTLDYDADIGAGTASPGAQLQANVGGPNFSRSFDLEAEQNGSWTMDYGAQGIDVTHDNWVNATITDADGDRTQAGPLGGGSPQLQASIEFDWISVNNFTPGGTVTYEIWYHAGRHLLFGPVTGPVDPYGGGWLDSQLHRVDLTPGNVIVATDNATGTTKSLTLKWIKFNYLDVETDVATGTAEPNATLYLDISETLNSGFRINVTADGNGNWRVDLAAEDHPINQYWWTTARIEDEDGDSVNAEAPRIEAEVRTDWVGIYHFTPNTTVTVEIYDAPGGNLIFGPRKLHADRVGNTWFNGRDRDYGFDLQTGQYMRVTDDSLSYTKDLLLRPVTYDELNTDQNYGRGTAEPGTRMTIHTNNFFANYHLNPLTDANGDWLADYGLAGYDLFDDMWSQAWVQDDNMDVSIASTTPPPTVSVSTQQDWINGWNFTPNGQVQVDIYDGPPTGGFTSAFGPGGPAIAGGLLFSGIFTAEGNTSLNINRDQHGIDLQPGYFVVATDLTSKQTTDLALQRLTFDSVDYDADTAHGTADPGAQVVVQASRPFEHYQVIVYADGDRNWMADFAAQGVDLTGDMSMSAGVYDLEGDITTANAPQPPVFTVSLTNDNVWGNNWPPSADLQIEVFDSQGGALLAGPFAVETDAYGNFGIDLWSQGADLRPGQYVLITDTANGQGKDTTLIDVAFTSVDFDQDIVYGTAPADTRLRICMGNQRRWEEFDFFSEADGTWAANFGAHLVDLTPDMGGNARIFDADGDATQADWRTPAPLSNFVVLGQQGVWLKEGTEVVRGDVGANMASEGPYLTDRSEVTIGQHVCFLNPDSRVLGDTVYLRQGSKTYDVYYNEIQGLAAVLGDYYTPLDLPLVQQLPAVPEVTPGTQNFSLPINGTSTLDAGHYGILDAKKGAIITFTGGVYHFSQWKLGDHVKVYFLAPTEIRIAGKLDSGTDSFVGPATGYDVTARGIFIYVLGINGNTGNVGATPKAAKFGIRAELMVNVYAPNGTLWIRTRSTATGAFFGKWVTIGEDVTVTLDTGWP